MIGLCQTSDSVRLGAVTTLCFHFRGSFIVAEFCCAHHIHGSRAHSVARNSHYFFGAADVVKKPSKGDEPLVTPKCVQVFSSRLSIITMSSLELATQISALVGTSLLLFLATTPRPQDMERTGEQEDPVTGLKGIKRYSSYHRKRVYRAMSSAGSTVPSRRLAEKSY